MGSRALAPYLWFTGIVAPRHVGSSKTEDRTCVPCIGRWILYHWATREARRDDFRFPKAHIITHNLPEVSTPTGGNTECNLWEYILNITLMWHSLTSSAEAVCCRDACVSALGIMINYKNCKNSFIHSICQSASEHRGTLMHQEALLPALTVSSSHCNFKWWTWLWEEETRLRMLYRNRPPGSSSNLGLAGGSVLDR